MTRCLDSRKLTISDRHDNCYSEEVDDDDDFDDDDVDGYEDFSDYEEEEIVRVRNSSRNNNSGMGNESSGSIIDIRRQRSISEGSNNIEPNEDNRRDHHNQLERKRRASIKTSYNDLREAIPSLRGSKASRAVILQRAVECIEDLVKLNRDHSHCVDTLKRQNELLDLRVQELQRLVHRMDDEEVCTSTNISGNSGTPTNITVRVINGSSAPSPNNSIYRYISHDIHALATEAIDQSGSSTASVQKINHLSSNRTNTMDSDRGASTSEVTLSSTANAILTTSILSAFSPTVSSDRSDSDPARSNSQRSSPSGMSSSSTASYAQISSFQTNRADGDTNSVYTRTTSSTGSIEDSVSTNQDGSSLPSTLNLADFSGQSSPPSILSNMPALQSSLNSSYQRSAQLLCSEDLDVSEDKPKRRKIF